MKYNPRLTLALANAFFAALLLSAAAPNATAQTETYEPYILRADQTDVRVWTSGETTHARVVLTFPTGGFRVTQVGPVTRQGNELSVDFVIDRWTGATTQAVVVKEYFFDLGALAPGAYTFTVKSRGANVKSASFDPSQIVEHWEETSVERVVLGAWTTGGVTFTFAELWFPDDGYRVAEWHAPERVGSDFVSRVKLERWTGRASVLTFKREKRLFVLGRLPADETVTLSIQFSDGVRQTSRPFTPAGTKSAFANPLDDPAFFVRQHYLDFLGREPDPEGLTFWYNELVTNCPFVPSPCMDARRVHVSAAFFLSIEFQTTGFYVYRLHKAAYGTTPRFADFMADTREAAEGLVVGRAGWEALVEENQRRLAGEFVARAEFKARYPETLTPAQYVDALNNNISHPFRETEPGALSASEREQLIQGLAGGTETRATVLSKMAAHPDFVRQELNRAFVLMQYFGYLRRDPDGEGYNFWLGKLNFFRGDYVAAEMVKAFISSDEYRRRFAAPQ
ncbi:MAG TPA: DUF4214 domain-containing protein [Pyrinomonadaceae bacterium]|jgi:hypothetical protein